MNRRDWAAQLAQNGVVTVLQVVRKPNVCVGVRCGAWEGVRYLKVRGFGFAKYNPNDIGTLPWNSQLGINKASGRALADLAERLAAVDYVVAETHKQEYAHLHPGYAVPPSQGKTVVGHE